MMPLKNFFDLVKVALPGDVRPEELQKFIPHEVWRSNPHQAVGVALKECPRFNWGAYLERNEDVKQAQADPCQHYVTNGIYEGRQLVSWHPLKEPEEPRSPLLSIVIINYNNAHLLNKCLDSVVNQTFKDIEIIIVDDSSTDESLDIINNYVVADKRIRVFVNEKNSATLVTRKRGVMAATGRYLMFLDSDDYLTPDACEIAVREIAKGYDMVKFGAHVFNSMRVSDEIIKACFDFCNRGENREYSHGEILFKIFVERKVNWLLWEFVFLREIVVAAFSELPNERLAGADDVLAVLAICRLARNMSKIPDKLYFYNFGPGVSLSNDKQKIFSYLPALCGSVKHIRDFAEKYSMNIGLESLYEELCDHQIQRMLSLTADPQAAEHFAQLTDILGFKYVFKVLVKRHGGEDEKIAAIVRPLPSAPRRVKHLGIYYPSLGPGGVEVIIQTVCRLFENDEYQITIFTEEKSDNELSFPPYVKIIYISPPLQERGNLLERMQGFEKAVVASKIDVMLHAGTWRGHILWDVLVLHQYAIPTIFLYHFNFALSLIRGGGQPLHFQDLVFRCAEAVTCLSTMEELYLRERGVNALYVPNPIRQFPYKRRKEIPTRIAVIGRFGSWIKQVGQCLKVLREVISRAPWFSMCLIGDFYTEQQREEYRKKVKEYGLEKNIVLTGWTENTNYFLQQCGVLLSTSYWEAFPLGIAEAQALGLPCVIYDLTIEQAKNNSSIIKVPQGDYKGAATEILDLYEDSEKWHMLSQIAVENCNKYTTERFLNNMRYLLNNFQSSMSINQYSKNDYVDIAKNMSFYSREKQQGLWD